MPNSMPKSIDARRSFLKGLGLLALANLSWPTVARAAESLERRMLGRRAIDLAVNLRAVPRTVQLYTDKATDVWSYEASVTKGGASRVRPSGRGFLGPILEVRTGELVAIEYSNEIPEESIIHWHGLDVPADQDGHPHQVVPPSGKFSYEFEIANRAGLYFFHPHPHGKLGGQVNRGLVGALIVRDAEEDSLGLPSGEDEHLVCIQDRRVNSDRQFEYMTGGMHDRMMGFHGNQLFLNGELNLNTVARRGAQRLRILNGSNARIYNLAWSDGRPLSIIGTDGGLLEKPLLASTMFLAPAERLDLIVDLSELAPGERLSLRSVPVAGAAGSSFDVATFEASTDLGTKFELPPVLSAYGRILESEAANLSSPKVFQLKQTREYGWTIDGLPYDMHGATAKETVPFGATEIWEFDNTLAGMPHPIHIHGTPFQILSRTSGKFVGAMDEGWKDTVLLFPGDKVRLIKRFNTHRGLFVYHCHNLEHEDMSMMRNFLIQ